ncbi:hypothetical protein H2O64_20875 [Kordia sp. YSTF-M3]|uniref:Tetratricopeptide repeat protein n=1 Tax=Kordia aestuariivivens TaxID=2759037 RepID=A0ABR7QF04_9FLAO|nr:hypothetical protein [Kordia aestuariivivens]MBC8757136.1 hypothetical protein [Kordia aestuariivivens]
MKIYYVLFIAFLTVGCNSDKVDYETYDKLVWEAMLEYKKQEYSKSLNLFQKAFKIIPNESVSDYFYAAAASLHLNKDILAKELITESIIQTDASKGYFERFDEFNQFRENKLFSEVEADYEEYKSQFLKNLKNPIAYKKLDSLLDKDQQARNSGLTAEERYPIDSTNVVSLIEITKKHGWQKKGWLILWHQRGNFKKDDYVWSFFRPYINQGIKNGEIRKDFWVGFEEQESITKNKKQIYGFYTNQFDQYPITDVQNVDKRRKEVGLPPLWYLNEIYGTQLPAGYQSDKTNF